MFFGDIEIYDNFFISYSKTFDYFFKNNSLENG